VHILSYLSAQTALFKGRVKDYLAMDLRNWISLAVLDKVKKLKTWLMAMDDCRSHVAKIIMLDALIRTPSQSIFI
jgi:hypothetical protein